MTNLSKLSTKDLLNEINIRRDELQATQKLMDLVKGEIITKFTPDSYETLHYLGTIRVDLGDNKFDWKTAGTVILIGKCSRNNIKLADNINKFTNGLVQNKLCGSSGPWHDDKYLQLYAVCEGYEELDIKMLMDDIKNYCPNFKAYYNRVNKSEF
jgi:hypothetical protein